MKIRALRGVCIGVNRHLKAGDTEDLEPAMVTFLIGIGAVEPIIEPIVKPIPDEPVPKIIAPEKPGKKEK